MTREETKELVRKISSLFPSWKIENPTKTVNDWNEYLKDESNYLLEIALDEYMRNGEVFAPSLSILLSIAKKHKPDPRFEGVDYWERRTKGIYPYEWNSETYRHWYTDDSEAQRFMKYLIKGIEAVGEGKCEEHEIDTLEKLFKRYEDKKCSMMKRG